MRRGVLGLVFASALVSGCGKKPVAAAPPAAPPAAPSAAFAEDSPETTLAWLAAQQNALDAAQDSEAAEKIKAAAETMKGRAINWPGTLSQSHTERTYGVTVWALHTDAPEPTGPPGEKREQRHYVMVCKPFEPGAALPENAPFVRQWDRGFKSGAGDWHRSARPTMPIRLAGTITAVQVHRNSWATGYGVKDRVVHTEVGFTLHITGGTVAPR